MPIRYKFDVLSALKEKGYSTYKLRKERLLAENTLQQLRNGDLVSWANIERLCHLLQCQPGDLLEYVEEAGGDQEITLVQGAAWRGVVWRGKNLIFLEVFSCLRKKLWSSSSAAH